MDKDESCFKINWKRKEMTLKFSENAMSEKEDLKRVIISYEKKCFI